MAEPGAHARVKTRVRTMNIQITGARLSTPEKNSISRKTKVQTNPGEKKRNVRGSVDSNVSVWDRVNKTSA